MRYYYNDLNHYDLFITNKDLNNGRLFQTTWNKLLVSRKLYIYIYSMSEYVASPVHFLYFFYNISTLKK